MKKYKITCIFSDSIDTMSIKFTKFFDCDENNILSNSKKMIDLFIDEFKELHLVEIIIIELKY